MYIVYLCLLQYQDIWRDVEVDVTYSLDPAVAARCTQNCPILEAFNGNDPQASTQAYIHKVVSLKTFSSVLFPRSNNT